MSYSPNITTVKYFNLFSLALIGLLGFVGFMSLLGWVTTTPLFPIVHIGYQTIKANSALLCIAVAIVIYYLPQQKLESYHKILFISALSLVAIICVLTICQYQFDINLGIDELLFKDLGKPTLGIYPGRVAPSAVVGGLLLLFCVLLFELEYYYIPQSVFLIIAIVAYSRIFADLLDLRFLNTGHFYSSIELNTATNVLLACLAILARFPTKGYCKVLTSVHSGSRTTRRIIPLAFFLSVGMVWLRTQATKLNLLGNEEAIVLSVTAFTIMILVIFFFYGRWINQVDVQKNKEVEYSIETEKKLRAVINNSFTLIWSIDRSYCYTMFNNLFSDVFYSEQKENPSIGKCVFPPDLSETVKERWKTLYDRAFAGETFTAEITEQLPDRYVELQLFLNPIENTEGYITEVSIMAIDVTQRRAQQAAAEENEAKFRAILENTNAVIWSLDKDCKYINFNQSFFDWAKKWNYTIQEGMPAVSLGANGLSKEWQALYDRVLSGESLDFEYIRPHKDGDAYMHFLLKPIYLKEQIIGATGIGIDITEKKLNASKIVESQARLQALLENTDAIIWAVDEECRYVNFNMPFVKWVKDRGYTISIGEKVQTLTIEQSKSDWGKYYDEVLLEGKSLDFEYSREFNGELIFMRFLLKPIYVEGKIIGATGLGLDVSERHYQRLKLEENQARLKALVEHTDAYVWSIDSNFRYITFNTKFRKIAKLFNKENIEFGDIVFENLEETPFIRDWKNVYNRVLVGESIEFEFDNEAFGQRFATRFLVNPIYLHDKIIGLTAIGVDILKEKTIQQELITAKEKAEDASQAKSRFLSVMSHEIRTPLNAVIGMTNLLMKDHPSKSQQEKLNAMKFSGEHLLNLVNDLLDFNKIEAGKIEFENIPMSYEQLATDIVNTFQYKAGEQGLLLQAEVDPSVPTALMGDPTRMMQVLTNLMGNAIKFTHQGSVILSIKVAKKHNESVELAISVKDTGIGIPADKLESIFDRFIQADSDTTRKYGGTGLGLPIAKRLLEMMGSDLKVESTVNIGTCFSFNLKAKITTENVAKNHSGQSYTIVEDLKSTRVLLVDDNPINRLVAEEFLNGWNAVVDTAENGLEAIAKVQTDEFDIVLMDLQMPIMDGYEASTIIRNLPDEKKRNIPILALTASALLEIREKIQIHGMNEYVSKPFEPTDLFIKIATQIGLKVEYKEKNIAKTITTTSLNQSINLISLEKLQKVTKGNNKLLTEFIAKIKVSFGTFAREYQQHLEAHSLDEMRKLIHTHRPTFELLEANQLVQLLDETKLYLGTENGTDDKIHTFNTNLKELLKNMESELITN